MALFNSSGFRLSPTAAREMLDNRFFPVSGRVEFPYLSDLLGSDWATNVEGPIEYRNVAIKVCEIVYGKAF